ncbi:MAG: acyl--CoA ligase [Clostridia bacterium]|nr:acyl--CoA ligase [Clostridia bacterium]
MENSVNNKPSQLKPWLQFFSKEAIASEMPRETIYNVIKKNNEGHEHRFALNYFTNRITYGRLFDEIDKVAASFKKLGVKKGDIVVCCTVTIPEMVYVLYALNKIGATLFTVDPRMPGEFVMKTVHDAKAKVLIYLDLANQLIEPIIPDLKVKKVIVYSATLSMPHYLRLAAKFKLGSPTIKYSDKVWSWKTFVKYGEGETTDVAEYGENNVAAITLTGGTTGTPKGVMLTNDGFNAIMHDFKNCGVKYTRYQRFLNIIPAFSSYGIVSSLHMPLGLGLEDVIIAKFDADKVGKYVKKYRPEHTLMVPAHYEKLMNSKEMTASFSLEFFETAGSGGDTMNEGLEQKLNNFLKSRGGKFPLSQGYGMSEVSSAAACSCDGNFRSMSVGYPLLTSNISIFEPGTTNELGFNEEGEICISGPSIMAGYFNNEKETEEIMIKHPDGEIWVHSGDLGYMDEDGYIFIKGRIKRMIILFNGHKVFPTQIEDVMGKHECVYSCAAVGVKDRRNAQGQRPLAVVQLCDGADKDAVRKELFDSFNTALDSSSVPFDIWFIDKMPRTGMDKIAYGQLADDYEEMIDKQAATV